MICFILSPFRLHANKNRAHDAPYGELLQLILSSGP